MKSNLIKKEDILSLGWEEFSENNYTRVGGKISCCLVVFPSNGYVEIDIPRIAMTPKTLFRGFLKNKKELKTLMGYLRLC